MNVFLWILQIVLAIWEIIGGLYVVHNHREVANHWALTHLPTPSLPALAVLQILFALGLVLPGAFKKFPNLTVISALGLAVISLLGIPLYTPYAGFFGMLWGLIPAILFLFVAYMRAWRL
jgi:DoxX-like family